MSGHCGTWRGEAGTRPDAPPHPAHTHRRPTMVSCARIMVESRGLSSDSRIGRRRWNPLGSPTPLLALCFTLLLALCIVPRRVSALWTYSGRMPNDNLADCSWDSPEAILSLTYAAAILPVFAITSILVWKRRRTFPLVGLHVPLLLANSCVAMLCIVARAVLFICWSSEGAPCGLEFIVLQSTILPFILFTFMRGIKLLFKYEITHHLHAVSIKLQEKEEEKRRLAGDSGESGAAASGTPNAWTAGSLVRSIASGDRPAPSSSLLRLQPASSPQARSHGLNLKSSGGAAPAAEAAAIGGARKPEKAKGAQPSFDVDVDTPPQQQPPNRLVAPESSVSRQRPNTTEGQIRSTSGGEPLSPANPASPTTGGRPRAASVAVSPIAAPSVEPQHGVEHLRSADVETDGADSPGVSPRARSGDAGTRGGGNSLDASPRGSPKLSPQFSPNRRSSHPAISPLNSPEEKPVEPGSPSSLLRATQRYAVLDADAAAANQDTRITIAAAATEETTDGTALLVATEGEAKASTAVSGDDASASSDDDLTLLYSGSSGWFVRHRKLVDRKHLSIAFVNAHIGAAIIMVLLSFWDPDTAMYGGGWTDTEIGQHLFSSPACTFMSLKQWLMRALVLLAIPLILVMWLRLKTKEADAFGLFHFMANGAVMGTLAIISYCVFLGLSPKWAGPSTLLYQLALFVVSDIKPLIASYVSSKERRRAFAAASVASRGGGGGGSESAISLRLKQFYRLRQVLRHPKSSAAFHAFTQKEFSSENYIFYTEAKKLIALATSLEQALPEWPRLGEDAHAPIAGIDHSRKTGTDGVDDSDQGGSLLGEGSTLRGRSLLRFGGGGNHKHHGPHEREAEAGIIELTSSPAHNNKVAAKSKYKPSARAVAGRPASAIAEDDADEHAEVAAQSQQHVTIHVTSPHQTKTPLTDSARLTSFHVDAEPQTAPPVFLPDDAAPTPQQKQRPSISLDDAPNVPSSSSAATVSSAHQPHHARRTSDAVARHARQGSLGVVVTESGHHRSSSLSPTPRHRPNVASQSLISQHSLPEQQQQQEQLVLSAGSPVVSAVGARRDRAASDVCPPNVSRSPSLKAASAPTAATPAPTALSLLRAGPVPADYSVARITQLREQAVEARRLAIQIYKQFIVRGSPFEVNVPHDLQGDIKAQIALIEEWQPAMEEKPVTTTGLTAGAPKVLALPAPPPLALSALYRPALVCIFDLMQRDSFRRFVVSPLFAAMLVDLEAELVADAKLKQEAAEAAATEAITRTRLEEENTAILDTLEREAKKAAKAGGTPLAGSRTPLALRRTAAAVVPSSPLPGSTSIIGVGGGNSRLGGGAERELHLLKSSPATCSPHTPSRNGKASAQPAPQQPSPLRSGPRSVHLQPSSASPSAPSSPGGWVSPSVVVLHAVAEDSGASGGGRGGQRSLPHRDSDGSGGSGPGSVPASPLGPATSRELAAGAGEGMLAPAAAASVSGSSRTATPRPDRSPALKPGEASAGRPVSVGASA